MLRFWQCQGLNWRINPCRHQKLALISKAHGVSRRKTFPNCSWTHLKRQIWFWLSGAVSNTLLPPPCAAAKVTLKSPPDGALPVFMYPYKLFHLIHACPSVLRLCPTFHNYSNSNCSILRDSRGVTAPSLPPPPPNTRLGGRNVCCVHVVAGRLTINLLL